MLGKFYVSRICNHEALRPDLSVNENALHYLSNEKFLLL